MQLTELKSKKKGTVLSCIAGFLYQLRHSTDAVSLTEFALVLPVFTTLGMYGSEVAYMATVNMQVAQLATSTADNASRIGQTNNSAVSPTVTELDINSIMFGARKQGSSYKFNERGRLILTSLEVDPATGKQWIHWQRCTGTKTTYTSAYGNATTQNGLNGAVLTGMGRSSQITAESGKAVMYVEVIYQYQGIFGTLFVNNPVFRKEAAYIIRDSRDLKSNTVQGTTGSGSTSTC